MVGRGILALAAAAAVGLATVGAALGAPGSLTFLDIVRQSPDVPLDGAQRPVLAPGGGYLYAPGTLDDAIVTLRVEADGTLGFVEADDHSGPANMLFPIGVAVAPEGDFVYVVANQSDSIVTFARNPSTGALTHVESLVPGTADVDAPQNIVLAPDGSKAYVTSAGTDSVATFARDPDGSLSFLERITNGDQGGTVTGLDNTTGIGMAPEATHVYVTNFDADSVVTFALEGDGTLDFVESDADPVVLNGPRGVTVSPDGANVYVAAENDDAIVTYARNPDGTLDFVESDGEGDPGVPDNSLRNTRQPLVSPDGRLVYVASQASDAVAIFERDPATGALGFRELVRDGQGADGLDGVGGLAFGEDARHLYAGAFDEGSVAAFSREPDPLTLALSAKRKQRAKKLRVTAECSAECAIELRARGRADGKRVKSRRVVAALSAGVRDRVRLRFKGRSRKLVADERGKVKVTAEATDEFAQTATDSVRVKLRP
jgi:6-phosphogluconolactonase (cycloisomerase 2 family)